MSWEYMRKITAELGAQLDWAARLDLPELPNQTEGLICGMGGSGIGGDYAAAWAELAGSRVTVNKNYGLPGWAKQTQPLVVAVSYSGNTEETLSAVSAALAEGLAVIAITSGGTLAEWSRREGFPLVKVPGGLPPRAALGYLLGAVLRVLHQAGVTPNPTDSLSEAAAVAERLSGPSGEAEEQTNTLAENLADKIVVVYGATGPTGVVAQRWKTQLNENSKHPAYWSLFPELNHNEIVGWSSRPELGKQIGIVSLRDLRFEGGGAGEPRALAARFRITEQVTGNMVLWVGTVEAQGEDLLARMISLTAVGDLVSLQLAKMSGVDPTPVDIIEAFKATLGAELRKE